MPTPDSPSSSNRRRPRVLIVDDMPQVRQELRLLLSLTGDLEVVGEAANGAEAIERAEALRPDVVVMDLEMPVMDGYAAARQIKTRWPACRIIALTVHDGEAERRRAAQAGVDAFIVKGVPVETLLQAIQEKQEGSTGFAALRESLTAKGAKNAEY